LGENRCRNRFPKKELGEKNLKKFQSHFPPRSFNRVFLRVFSQRGLKNAMIKYERNIRSKAFYKKNKGKHCRYFEAFHVPAQLKGGRKRKKKLPMYVRTFFGAGRCFIVRRPHFARTPFKHGLVATSLAAMSRPHCPLAPQWPPFWRAGPLELAGTASIGQGAPLEKK
jgi:hypothetical protein